MRNIAAVIGITILALLVVIPVCGLLISVMFFGAGS